MSPVNPVLPRAPELPAPQDASGSFLSDTDRSIFDGSRLGVVETDLDRNVLYANQAAMIMLGAEDYRGLTLDQAFVRPSARAILERALEDRRRGMLGNYRTELTRLSDETDVKVDITGIPLTDQDANVVGALGIFRSLEHEQLAANIQQLARDIESPGKLLRTVAERVRPFIPFDLMIVSRYSSDMNHADTYFVQPVARESNDKLWYPLTEEQKHFLRSEDTRHVDDIERLLAEDPWRAVREEKFVQWMLHEGIRSSLRRTVRQPGRYRATISLLSRSRNFFDDVKKELFDSLPLDQVVLRALEHDERRRDALKIELLLNLNRCTSVLTAAQLLADQLVNMFHWSDVEIFRVDHVESRIRSLARSPQKASANAPQEGQRVAKAGLLSVVVLSKRMECVNDFAQHPSFDPEFDAEVGSRLCCPISFEHEKRVDYIIRVDDRHAGAFTSDHQQALEEIATEVGALLQRIGQVHFLTTCFDASSDGTIVTDQKLQIKKANPAAAALLGVETTKEVEGTFRELFDADPTLDEQLACEGDLGVFLLKRKSGDAHPIPVFVSRRQFSSGFSGSVFMLRDTRPMRQTLMMEALEQAAYEVAVETRGALIRGIAQLEALATRPCNADSAELDIVRRQLVRVKAAYTRLALFNPEVRAAGPDLSLVDVRAELTAICHDLTDEEKQHLALSMPPELPPIQGDHLQLRVVFETLLSALLRARPKNQERINVTVSADGNSVFVQFAGKLLSLREAGDPHMLDARSDLRLASPLLAEIVTAHGGELRVRIDHLGQTQFTCQFPSGGNDA